MTPSRSIASPSRTAWFEREVIRGPKMGRHRRAENQVAGLASGQTAGQHPSVDLEGIGFETESRRYYPKRSLLAPVLGYVGLDSQGMAGLEHEIHELAGEVFQGKVN